MFRKVIDGTLYTLTRQEVVDKTKIVVIADKASGSDEDKYASLGDLYNGVYKQNDRANSGDGTKETIFYDLSGCQVTNPQKGIFIQNGKKIHVK